MHREDKIKPPHSTAISLLSPSIQEANSLAASQICEIEADSTFASDFESLFSPGNVHPDYLEDQPIGHGDVIGTKVLSCNNL